MDDVGLGGAGGGGEGLGPLPTSGNDGWLRGRDRGDQEGGWEGQGTVHN